MNKWAWIMRIFYILVLLLLILVLRAHSAPASMPVPHLVPVPSWKLYSHYCCTGAACTKHHLELRFTGEYYYRVVPERP